MWLTLGVATIGFGGMFAVYSCITPTLVEETGVAEASVPWFLALWGLGMVVGNIVGGWLADRSLIPAIVGIIVWNIVFLAIFFLAAHSPIAAGASTPLPRRPSTRRRSASPKPSQSRIERRSDEPARL
jgi:predicted MFS family arabinose efflux permease